MTREEQSAATSAETSAAWTPGPWVIYRVKDGPNRGKMLGIGDADGSGIVPDIWRSGAEYEANARLISAAPDMYEALHDLIVSTRAILEKPDDASRRPHATYYVARAEAALAKADGQS